MTGIYFIGNAVLIHRFLPDSLYERSEGSFLIRSFRYSGLERPRQHPVIFFFILPRQKARRNLEHLSNSFLACMFAQALFIIMPKGSPLSAMLIFPDPSGFICSFPDIPRHSFHEWNGGQPEERPLQLHPSSHDALQHTHGLAIRPPLHGCASTSFRAGQPPLPGWILPIQEPSPI